MNAITEFLAGLTITEYILIYLGLFVLGILLTVIDARTKIKVFGPAIPVLALLGGMLAIGYVTINMDKNIGLGILLVWAVFSSIIVFPCLWLHDKIEKPLIPEKSAAQICAENGHQWEATENAGTIRCARCGKTKVKKL